MKKVDWMAGAALAMAIVGTASAEYHLAVAAGWGQVAFALPGCLDIYALRALRAHRDMLAVLVALIVVNSVSHLIAVGLLAPSVWVVIGVSSIAPAVLWRVHALRDEAMEPEPEALDNHFRDLPELTGTSGKLPEVPAEPGTATLDVIQGSAPVPVTLERVPEVSENRQVPSGWPLLGPMVPVAELLAGTSRDQEPSVPYRRTEPTPEPAEPAPLVPEPEPEPHIGSDEPDPVPRAVAAEHIEAAREWLADEPELTGTAIGTKLGKSDSYGRRVRRAALGATS